MSALLKASDEYMCNRNNWKYYYGWCDEHDEHAKNTNKH